MKRFATLALATFTFITFTLTITGCATKSSAHRPHDQASMNHESLNDEAPQPDETVTADSNQEEATGGHGGGTYNTNDDATPPTGPVNNLRFTSRCDGKDRIVTMRKTGGTGLDLIKVVIDSHAIYFSNAANVAPKSLGEGSAYPGDLAKDVVLFTTTNFFTDAKGKRNQAFVFEQTGPDTWEAFIGGGAKEKDATAVCLVHDNTKKGAKCSYIGGSDVEFDPSSFQFVDDQLRFTECQAAE